MTDPVPRTIIEAPSPGCPPPEVTWTPATVPSKDLVRLPTGLFERSSPLTTLAEPVKDSFFAVPYATTITSSSKVLSSLSTKSISFLPSTGSSLSAYPRQPATSTASPGMPVRVYLPSSATIVPLELPFNITTAPVRGSPFTSSTRPLTAIPFCAKQKVGTRGSNTVRMHFPILFIFHIKSFEYFNISNHRTGLDVARTV